MAATDAQVQQFVNDRVRPRAEQLRAVYLAIKDDKAVIDDVYENVSAPSPTWTDSRSDAPPHFLTPSNVLAYNAFITNFISFIETGSGATEWPVIQDTCVRSL